MINPKQHQLEKAEKCWEILKKFGYVYLSGKPRSGKTLTSIVTAEKSTRVVNVIVLTTKNAVGYPKKLKPDGTIDKDSKGKEKLVTDKNSSHYIKDNEEGWLEAIKKSSHWIKHNYDIINYEQAGSIITIKRDSKGRLLKTPKKKLVLKIDPNKYQLAIIDESHNLGVLGKPTGRVKIIQEICKNLPHIHLSGTAIVESPNSIYHQMAISKFKPFKQSNFYEFFKVYGIPYYIKAQGRDIQQYDKANLDLIMPRINEFTVYMTQEDAGIPKELQAIDKLHYVELNKTTRDLYNKVQKDLVAEVWEGMLSGATRPPKPTMLVCDTVMKLRTSLHMIEAGIVKIDDEYIMLGNTEKIDYIKSTWGDNKFIGIMSHFIGERILISREMNSSRVYSSKADAEGVDLSYLNSFIHISSDYSGAKFIQRRDRIINTEGSNTLEVNHILVKGAISEQVYKRVSKKEDFNNKTYEKKWI